MPKRVELTVCYKAQLFSVFPQDKRMNNYSFVAMITVVFLGELFSMLQEGSVGFAPYFLVHSKRPLLMHTI